MDRLPSMDRATLLAAFMDRRTIYYSTGVKSGIINRIEHEDGSCYSFNLYMDNGDVLYIRCPRQIWTALD